MRGQILGYILALHREVGRSIVVATLGMYLAVGKGKRRVRSVPCMHSLLGKELTANLFDCTLYIVSDFRFS